jgi:hypothetical protein
MSVHQSGLMMARWTIWILCNSYAIGTLKVFFFAKPLKKIFFQNFIKLIKNYSLKNKYLIFALRNIFLISTSNSDCCLKNTTQGTVIFVDNPTIMNESPAKALLDGMNLLGISQ